MAFAWASREAALTGTCSPPSLAFSGGPHRGVLRSVQGIIVCVILCSSVSGGGGIQDPEIYPTQIG